MTALFFSCVLLLFSCYIFYPVLLLILACFHGKISQKSALDPSVSFIIVAHNEEASISKKIENTLQIDHPTEKIEILIALDGCTDRTESLTRKFEPDGIRVLPYNDRPGKYSARRLAVEESRGDILVFSDANAFLEKMALRNLLKHFSDVQVGAVCGNLIYRSSRGLGGEALFKRYDNWIKEMESRTGSTILAEGSLCAVRRELYPLSGASWTTDLTIPMNVVRAGKRVLFEKDARSTETFDLSNRDEIQRRANITHLTLATLLHHCEFLNPFRYGLFSIKLWFHRVLLLLSPFFLLFLFVSNACLVPAHRVWAWFFLIQSVCYFCVSLLPGSLFSYFYFSQIAILKGFWRYFRKIDATRWKPFRSATIES